MCGIAGEVSFSHYVSKNKESFLRMRKALNISEAEPNEIYINDKAALIKKGAPISEESFSLIFSGKLFNSAEVKHELTLLGYKFREKSDEEIVLKAFMQWREKCVEKFNGTFAFAVWNEKDESLFFARDRIGVKPFFYSVKNNSFIFGSEIKVLLAHDNIDPIIDENSIAEIMFIGPGRTPGYGVFKDIKELKPACCGYYSKNGIKIKKYWTLRDKEHTDTFPQTVEKVRYLVKDAITRQLISDQPVGTLLSGGLDSSIVSTVANLNLIEKGERLKTFSVTYEDNDKYFKKSKFQPNSDTEYIKIMSDYLGCEHHLITLNNKDLANALFEAVEARDLPGMADIDSSLLLFCKEIKKYCGIALSGECADEIFGGYPWYRNKEIRAINGFPWAQSTAYRKRFIRDEIKIPDGDNYVYSRYRDTIINTSKADNISPAESRMKEMMKLNLDWFMQTLLDRNDRMSSRSGLELRAPFCDYRIVEYLYSVPWEFKDYKSYEKGLLREAAEGLLPKDVLWRKKSPYPKTHNPAYLKLVSDMLYEITENQSSPLLSFIKKEELQKLLKTEKSEPWYGQLMTTPQTIAYFIQINYWLEKYKIIIK